MLGWDLLRAKRNFKVMVVNTDKIKEDSKKQS